MPEASLRVLALLLAAAAALGQGQDGHVPEHQAQDGHVPEYQGQDGHVPEHQGQDGHIPEYQGQDGHVPGDQAQDGHVPEYQGQDGHVQEHQGQDGHVPEHQGQDGHVPGDQGQHDHGQPDGVMRSLEEERLTQHLMQHLQGQAHLHPETMSAVEKQFHLFLAHDHDQDLLLDGIELMQSFFYGTDRNIYYSEEEMSERLDPLLHRYDTDQDGKLSFSEYMLSL